LYTGGSRYDVFLLTALTSVEIVSKLMAEFALE
jgi:hypothetical protein